MFHAINIEMGWEEEKGDVPNALLQSNECELTRPIILKPPAICGFSEEWRLKCRKLGYGTNDAPALRRSDVGFALGSGTETAREASDIVLLRDDFASVVEAIQYGRNVFESIEKFITFQLTANVTCVVVSVGGALAYARAPLSAIELLFVNLVIDSLASLALATDPPSDEALRQPPADAGELRQ